MCPAHRTPELARLPDSIRIQLSRSLAAALVHAAATEGVSRAALVREALTQALVQREVWPPKAPKGGAR
jgi:hypothetical protein